MNETKIRNQLLLICRQVFNNYDIDDVSIEHIDFIKDLGMDSIAFITLIIDIENSFNITISDDLLLMDNFNSINKIFNYVSAEINYVLNNTQNQNV